MIYLNSVNKSFKDHQALDGLNLRVESGEIYGLLGSNGAGKSTTINLLLGFEHADSGDIKVKDIDPGDDGVQARKLIGYIPENVNLYPYLTGLENLEYFCKLAGLKYTQSELSLYLTTCMLDKKVHDKKVATYSKGMRQKVGIAIALAKKAEVYLLDEPASGLDPSASNELSALLKNIAGNGATVLMASHDIFRVRETCNRIGILKDGQLLKEVQASEVSSNELEVIYLKYMQN